MKKALVATILGIAASAATSFGQGFINFDNYVNNGSTGAQITFNGQAPGPVAGTPIPDNFQAHLWYALGTVADPTVGGTLISSSTMNQGTGYFSAGNVAIPNYVSGPITFRVTADGTFASTPWFGQSATWTLPSIATGTSIPGITDFAAFAVAPVPEPSTFALAGLGSAALLIFRRRK